MAKFGSFARGGAGGGMGNMQDLMRQAQKMQEEALKAQEEIEETEVEGSASGGMVTVKMAGNKRVNSIKINPSAVDADDVEMLEDLIVAALGDAYNKAEELKQQKMGRFGSALGGLM